LLHVSISGCVSLMDYNSLKVIGVFLLCLIYFKLNFFASLRSLT
jgi:hypothetical protein